MNKKNTIMSNFFSKIINKLKDNGIDTDVNVEASANTKETTSTVQGVQTEEEVTQFVESSNFTEEEQPYTIEILEKNKKKETLGVTQTTNRGQLPNNVTDAIELQELTLNAILNTFRPFAFGNTAISAIRFHLKYGNTRVESIASSSLFKNDDFINHIKVKMSGLGIKYADNFRVYLIYSSPDFERFSLITQWLNVEPIPQGGSEHKIKASVKAVKGFIWGDVVEIEPTEEPCYIGRGREPELPSGISVLNKVAFISPDEINDPKYEINRYVSRSIAYIFYDQNSNEFKIMRSKLMDNSQHIVKIVRIRKNSVEKISLNNTMNEYTLKDGDQITFNEKVSLKISIFEVD